MKIQVDEEGQQAIDSIIETGMRRGAWGKDDVTQLAVIKQTVTLIEEPDDKDVE
jgi:hypothetical protein